MPLRTITSSIPCRRQKFNAPLLQQSTLTNEAALATSDTAIELSDLLVASRKPCSTSSQSTAPNCPFATIDSTNKPDRYARSSLKDRRYKQQLKRTREHAQAAGAKIVKTYQVAAKQSTDAARRANETYREWEPTVKQNFEKAAELLVTGWNVLDPHVVPPAQQAFDVARENLCSAYKYCKTREFWLMIGNIAGYIAGYVGWLTFATMCWTAEGLFDLLVHYGRGLQMRHVLQVQVS